MKIDKKLNLVLPIVDENGEPTAYVHSTPIGSNVFDMYFLPLARTYSAIFSLGLGPVAGPKVADKMLKKMSIDIKMWDGEAGVERGLIAEIHRLTQVIAPGKNGWETIPYKYAKDSGVLSKEDAAEVDAAIVFFIVTSAMHPKAELKDYLQAMCSNWGARIELLNCTEFQNSLPNLSLVANTGGMAAA